MLLTFGSDHTTRKKAIFVCTPLDFKLQASKRAEKLNTVWASITSFWYQSLHIHTPKVHAQQIQMHLTLQIVHLCCWYLKFSQESTFGCDMPTPEPKPAQVCVTSPILLDYPPIHHRKDPLIQYQQPNHTASKHNECGAPSVLLTGETKEPSMRKAFTSPR